MTDTVHHAPFLAVVIENTELRRQLAEVHDQCIEWAVDARDLHVENAELRARLTEIERNCDVW
jgi:hypothetical protein